MTATVEARGLSERYGAPALDGLCGPDLIRRSKNLRHADTPRFPRDSRGARRLRA